jgi:hypothetical protein
MARPGAAVVGLEGSAAAASRTLRRSAVAVNAARVAKRFFFRRRIVAAD